MADDLETTTRGSRGGFWVVLLGVALGAVLLSVWLKNAVPRSHSGLPAGESAPAIEAAGWINGEAPTQTPEPGTIRVMHAWFTTCPACYHESKELVKLHAEYHDQGVEFVGLTYEPTSRLPDIEAFLRETGITWVNGYGALETLRAFGVEYFPSVWIIDFEGRILWNYAEEMPLEKAIPLALAGKLPAENKTRP